MTAILSVILRNIICNKEDYEDTTQKDNQEIKKGRSKAKLERRRKTWKGSEWAMSLFELPAPFVPEARPNSGLLKCGDHCAPFFAPVSLILFLLGPMKKLLANFKAKESTALHGL